MSAFLGALATLHTDPNLSVLATWARGNTSAEARVIVSAPDVVHAVSQGGVVDLDAMAMARMADLPQMPRAGDTLTVSGTTYTVVSAERDAEGITWRMGLRGAPATTTAGTALAGAVPA